MHFQCSDRIRFIEGYAMYLVTYYSQVMVAQALDLARETYFAILMDRDSNGPVMVWHCIYCSKTNMDFIEIISNLINNVSRIFQHPFTAFYRLAALRVAWTLKRSPRRPLTLSSRFELHAIIIKAANFVFSDKIKLSLK